MQRLRAVGLTDRLREQAGWPVPRQYTVEADGCLFVIQDLVPGAPVGMLTHALVDRLLELHARAPRPRTRRTTNSTWPDALIADVDDRRRRLLRARVTPAPRRRGRLAWSSAFEQIGRDARPSTLVGGDIVHWDWHPGNLLEVDGELTAVIDNDFVTTGDAGLRPRRHSR